jgi:tight adherence protein C
MIAAGAALALAVGLAVYSLVSPRRLRLPLGLGSACGALLLPAGPAAAVGGGAAAGYLVTRVSRRRAAGRGARRRQALEARLPDALDLLAGAMEAGAPLDRALALVARSLRGPIAEELGACTARLEAGGSRRAAFTALADSGVPDLGRIGGALATADELGAPLAVLLRDQASLQRELRRLRVRERAARAGPKMALAVSVLLVPAGLLLVLGAQVLGLLASASVP